MAKYGLNLPAKFQLGDVVRDHSGQHEVIGVSFDLVDRDDGLGLREVVGYVMRSIPKRNNKITNGDGFKKVEPAVLQVTE